MFNRFGASGSDDGFDSRGLAEPAIARPGQLDPLLALERIGARRSFTRDQEIYAEGDPSDSWYKVVSGTVRVSKLLADSRRHIANSASAAIVSFSTPRANVAFRQKPWATSS